MNMQSFRILATPQIIEYNQEKHEKSIWHVGKMSLEIVQLQILLQVLSETYKYH